MCKESQGSVMVRTTPLYKLRPCYYQPPEQYLAQRKKISITGLCVTLPAEAEPKFLVGKITHMI